MYKIFFSFLSLLIISCAGSQSGPKWSSVSLMYESGPLPPKYQYSYTVTINTNGDGGVVCFVGADPSNPSLTYDFKCTPENTKKIDEAIKKSKILEDEITEMPEGKRPIGGHLEKVRVILENENPNLDQPPKVKESPYFPDEKYRSGLNNLYETIQKIVPSSVWDDFEKKKSEYQSKN
ncbi:MAG: hypothetical protein HY959_06500 [Ignavibacteriae bacterium]|nr:hypothetical protein [Ignavibacteriota bacterium]